MRVLVTGGAGYIGSHMALQLRAAGIEVVVFDNLSTGHADAVPDATLIVGDLRHEGDVRRALSDGRIDAVMHFAACCYVGESMSDPGKYFQNNIVGTANLLAAMREAGVERIVLSSSCSTYGDPVRTPIDESHPQAPVNPYGYSKLVSERMIREYVRAHGFRAVALRYFNAAGCDAQGRLGERHDPETHLIPLVLMEALRVRSGGAASGTKLRVFGDDFQTPDGTCVRDYVHVEDLCAAHLSSLRWLDGRPAGFHAFNLGTGRGDSVKQVIEACKRVTGFPIGYSIAGRRPGDPSHLVANADLARAELGWVPRYSRLDEIVATAWRWMSK